MSELKLIKKNFDQRNVSRVFFERVFLEQENVNGGKNLVLVI
jgi:hypothetical protein